MSDGIFGSLTTILMAVVGVAILAVIVSRNSNTAGVLTAGGKAFGGILTAAMGPVSTGAGYAPSSFSL